jgi:aspartate kinase
VSKGEARITLNGVPDVPGTSLAIFSRIAARNIAVDMIVQNVGEDGRADVSFTVPHGELKSTLAATQEAADALGALAVNHDPDTAKVSVVGLGMAQQTGVAGTAFQALAEAGVNIQMITTSEIKISVLVSRADHQKALRALHAAFQCETKPEDAAPRDAVATGKRTRNAIEVIARLQGMGMEDLTIDGIDLDETQARVTIASIPDEPGVAAKIFAEIASANIFVDMIVQSFGRDGRAALTVTVPHGTLAKTLEVAQRISKAFGCGHVSHSPRIAKLAVSGIGLRSHTGVAIRMFKALAEQKINVDLINTSEVRVNVAVEGSQGKAALKALQAAFADVLR